jgi:uncharacterized membrane protein YgdD (TMEM256/DUF423 family)
MKAGNWILVAGVFAFLAVAFGAFGAHALSERFGEYEKGVWHTAVLYHLVHALALLAFGIGIANSANPAAGTPGVQAIGWLFSAGIFLFSGSLYVLALSGVKVLGAVTPFGGLAFLAGWVLVARAGYFMAQASGN